MNVFDLDMRLVERYQEFTRSFTSVRAPDLKAKIDEIYASDAFWPEPLIGLNPNFRPAQETLEALAAKGAVDAVLPHIFAAGDPRQPIRLHRHQEQALSKAQQHKNFIVTTGTGSGKSLCFFVPIIDHILRARRAGEPQRTRAIIIYPMNALANSQREELEKFIGECGLPDEMRPTFRRYTGQEQESERRAAATEKPDIILTNFMMLELLMTRQDELDRSVIENMSGLEFLVLDELHTYRGRQGADVAMLVRRVRERVGSKKMLCIGTSATMASGEEDAGRRAVADVGTRLFGSAVSPDDVITETLERRTIKPANEAEYLRALRATVTNPPQHATADGFETDPLAVWIEENVGLDLGETAKRRPPMTLTQAAKNLGTQIGLDEDTCRAALVQHLVAMSDSKGTSDRAFMAFKLHRFIAGAGHAHATLEPAGRRTVSLSGEKFDRETPDARLYPLFFCRECGQEVHSVSIDDEGQVLPRSIDVTPEDEPDLEGSWNGFLVPDAAGDLAFSGSIEDYPDAWLEEGKSGLRLKASHRGKHEARLMFLAHDGREKGEPTGVRSWFFPGKFRFCPHCGYEPAPQARDINKLAGLSSEGRSSATTMITTAALDWMDRAQTPEDRHRRKLLGFTDNRQDAALQAGHFNDFIFVTLLRGAMLRAVDRAGAEGLSHEEFGNALRRALGFEPEDDKRRGEWMLDSGRRDFAALDDAKRTMNRVLAHRLWTDLRRGWRYTNPNLDQLGLLRVVYPGIALLAGDEAACAGVGLQAELTDAERRGFALLSGLASDVREQVFVRLFDAMRQGLAVAVDALDATDLDQVAERSRLLLKDPWAIGKEERENLSRAGTLVVGSERKKGERDVIRATGRSVLGREIGKRADASGLSIPDREALITAMLRAAESHYIVRKFATRDLTGWRLAPDAVRLHRGAGETRPGQDNAFFAQLYSDVALRLADTGALPFGFEAREHTAQVKSEVREWRENRFRYGPSDIAQIAEDIVAMRDEGEPQDFLPVLFCSPTMELGVDISQLNFVYLRNAPPTPANYVQRAGRAGRSGQAALVVTYCAAQSPHDQYYFERRSDLVAGIVRPPAIDLANPDLLAAHVQAEWLAACVKPLQAAIPANLELVEGLPLSQELAAAASDASADQIARSRAIAAIRSAVDDRSLEAEGLGTVEAFVTRLWRNAPEAFSLAFDRWRKLRRSTQEELEAAQEITRRMGLSQEQRAEAGARQHRANKQLELLDSGRASSGSDFYSYRYLATEGFLPGYNFPRLPLYAFIDAERGSTMLQRPRFLAIAEFGPNSLVYHEGKAYRCNRAKLPAGTRDEGGNLATRTLTCCTECGAAHDDETQERCVVCASSLTSEGRLSKLYRIENVEAVPGARITANDEDRQRRGFDVRTIFTWPEGGQKELVLGDNEGALVTLRYGPQTLLARANLGLRRRKAQEVTGFDIDTLTGRWLKNDDGSEDEGADIDPRSARRQSIVPMVEDTKNALLVQFAPSLGFGPVQMATLQHALVRAIETLHVLETGELLGEPLPTRDNRRAILLYEVSEGGAGVLKRLMAGPSAWRALAEAALDLMHLERGKDGALHDGENACVEGCYRCLLSYYNQPDHELIERSDSQVQGLLDRLTRCDPMAGGPPPPGGEGWLAALERWGAPTPMAESVAGADYPLCWPGLMVMATIGPPPPGLADRCADMGRLLIELPERPGDTMPTELAAALGVGE